MTKPFLETRFAQFFQHPGEHIANIWKHLPEEEKIINEVIAGFSKLATAITSNEADVIAAAFPNGVGTKTLAEIRKLLPEATAVVAIEQKAQAAFDACTGTEAEKANAFFAALIAQIETMPSMTKNTAILSILSAFVAKILGCSTTQAAHMISTKQLENVAAAS